MLIAKVDSLNTINVALKEENVLAKEILTKREVVTTSLKKKNKALEKINESLEKQIAPGRKIKTSIIKAVAMKEKSSGRQLLLLGIIEQMQLELILNY